MARRPRRFHSDRAARQRPGQLQQLAAPHRARHDRRAPRVGAVNLKNIPNDIEPMTVTDILAHRCHSGRRPPDCRNPQRFHALHVRLLPLVADSFDQASFSQILQRFPNMVGAGLPRKPSQIGAQRSNDFPKSLLLNRSDIISQVNVS